VHPAVHVIYGFRIVEKSRKVSEEFMSGQQGEEVWAMMA
jgi:hypothetical protein